MDPHPLANLFKRSSYVEPISSELSALDCLYEDLPENHESENCDQVLEEKKSIKWFMIAPWIKSMIAMMLL